MERKLWNPTLPQTLIGAVFLLYANVVTSLLFRIGNGGLFALGLQTILRSAGARDLVLTLANILGVAFIALSALAGYLIVNERKNGWLLGIVVGAAPLVAIAMIIALHPRDIGLFDLDLIGLLFDIALFVCVIHPQSREYVKIWFK